MDVTLTITTRADLGVMIMKEYFPFPGLMVLEPQFSVIPSMNSFRPDLFDPYMGPKQVLPFWLLYHGDSFQKTTEGADT